jgi:hypothetical protein
MFVTYKREEAKLLTIINILFSLQNVVNTLRAKDANFLATVNTVTVWSATSVCEVSELDMPREIAAFPFDTPPPPTLRLTLLQGTILNLRGNNKSI